MPLKKGSSKKVISENMVIWMKVDEELKERLLQREASHQKAAAESIEKYRDHVMKLIKEDIIQIVKEVIEEVIEEDKKK